MWLAKFAQLIRRGAGFKPRQSGSHFCVLNATLHWGFELPRQRRSKRQTGFQAKGRAKAKTLRQKRILIFWETDWADCIFRKIKQKQTNKQNTSYNGEIGLEQGKPKVGFSLHTSTY